VDLTPAGAYESYAYATDGVHQGGDVTTENGTSGYAAMWSGTASSVINMTPPWATIGGISGMAPGQQVGVARTVEGEYDATIWFGDAASAIDVHPFPGFGGSRLLATTGSVQVGWSNVPGLSFPVAGMWFGTAASFVNLQDYLPPGYGSSVATSVTDYNGRIIVGGYADGFNGPEAFIWVGVPAPGPLTALALAGFLAPRRRQRRPADKVSL
jgi:hypothetical protein